MANTTHDKIKNIQKDIYGEKASFLSTAHLLSLSKSYNC